MKFILLIFLLPLSIAKQYAPDWKDFDTRPLPEWYDKAKIGIVIDWGVFSVPCYGPSTAGFWENFDVVTQGLLQYQFFPFSSGFMQFKVRAFSNAHVALTMTPKISDPKYVLVVGGWVNTESALEYNYGGDYKDRRPTPQILNSQEFRGFWLRWDNVTLSFGKEGQTIPLLSWRVSKPPLPIAFVGVATGYTKINGIYSSGTWKINVQSTKEVADYMQKNYPPGFTYQEFAPKFTAEFFDANQWATLFYDAGAKYVVVTSKTSDGYTLFPSKHAFSYNSVEVGPHGDIVDELSKSVRSKSMKFGVTYELYDKTRLFGEDFSAKFETRKYVDYRLRPEIEQLINDYKPSILWVDIIKVDGEYPKAWNITELVAWLYNDSPVKDEIVTNDRWNGDCFGAHGDVYNYNPYHKVPDHKFENKIKLNRKLYGYMGNALLDDILTFDDLLFEIVSAVSFGGNAAIHVSATKDGSIPTIYQELLLDLGNWLKINGEAIYESSPWFHQNDQTNKDVWYTCRKDKYNATNPTAIPSTSDTVTAIYAILLKWPKGGQVLLQQEVMSMLLCHNYELKLLGNDDVIEWKVKKGQPMIILPDITKVVSTNAWTFKFTPKPKTRRQQLAGSAARWCNHRRSSQHRPRIPDFVDIEKPEYQYHNLSSTYRRSNFFSN